MQFGDTEACSNIGVALHKSIEALQKLNPHQHKLRIVACNGFEFERIEVLQDTILICNPVFFE
jgi:protoheme ferro-lyase